MGNKKFKVGDKVKYINTDHAEHPDFYPLYGTIGEIKEDCGNNYCVQWPKGSTSDDDCWYCDENDIELVKDVDMTNEEIWKMLKPKMEKNSLTTKNVHAGLFGPIYTYNEKDVHNAIALAYRSGYERAMKGRPFKIGEKKKKGGHWEPVDPNNLPKEGTRVRYNKNKKLFGLRDGTTGIVSNNKFGFNIRLDNRNLEFLGHAKDAVAFDMWVEDNE